MQPDSHFAQRTFTFPAAGFEYGAPLALTPDRNPWQTPGSSSGRSARDSRATQLITAATSACPLYANNSSTSLSAMIPKSFSLSFCSFLFFNLEGEVLAEHSCGCVLHTKHGVRFFSLPFFSLCFPSVSIEKLTMDVSDTYAQQRCGVLACECDFLFFCSSLSLSRQLREFVSVTTVVAFVCRDFFFPF